MAQGAAFGVGSGVAHAAVNSVLGGGRSHGGSGEAPPAYSEGGYAQEGAQPGYYEEAKEPVQENPCVSFNSMFLQ